MPDVPHISRRANRLPPSLRWVVAIVCTLLTAGVLALSGHAAAGAVRPDAVQRSLDALVRGGDFPGALAAVRGRDGRVRNYTAGVADLRTKAKVPVDGQVRIGSNTKTFVATVVLQLVGEGRIGLDTPIERYLPKVVRGKGIDGRRITVRQLLQHTSGVPDYDQVVAGDILAVRNTFLEPQQLLDVALREKARFAPGAGWEYSNTNYVLLGLLVQRVTSRPIGEVITRRVIDRIGLRRTYWPGVGDRGIREPHPHGYHRTKPGGPLVDVTEFDPSLGWAAGQLIATQSDLLTFFTALLDGKLLPPRQLRQMQSTVEAPGFDVTGGSRYGLGLATTRLSGGGFAWSHGGDISGFETRNGVTPDGRAAVIAVTALPSTLTAAKRVADTLDVALRP